MKKIALQHIGVLSLFTFVIHGIWENIQAPLFDGYLTFSQHFFICFTATLGDVFFTLVIWAMIAFLKEDLLWMAKINTHDLIVLVLIGFFLAISIEQRALLQERWSYAEMMPMLAYFRVGLMPVLQMTILLPFSLYCTGKFFTEEEIKIKVNIKKNTIKKRRKKIDKK